MYIFPIIKTVGKEKKHHTCLFLLFLSVDVRLFIFCPRARGIKKEVGGERKSSVGKVHNAE
jgi:hypothetical protein